MMQKVQTVSMLRKVAALFALVAGSCAAMAADPGGPELFDLVRAYSAIGDHRTGSAADEATAQWFAAELQRRGAKIESVPFGFERYDAQVAVTLDGKPVPALALYYEGSGDVVDDHPHVAAAAVLEGDKPSAALEAAIAQARAAGAKSLVVATLNPAGDLQVPNRQPHSPAGLPVVLVPGRLSDALKSSPVRLSFSARTAPSTSRNVVASFGDTSRMPLVIATPLSCWFQCAGERGTGVALALALAERMAAKVPVLVVGSPGHELLPHVGLQAFLAQRKLQPLMVLHLGANVALGNADGSGFAEQRAVGLRMGAAMAERIRPALAPLGGKVFVNPPRWLGEAELWAHAVDSPLMSFVGAGPQFHTPGDTPQAATSAALMEKAYRALSAALDAWMVSVPGEVLARVRPQVNVIPVSEIDARPTGDCFWLAAVSPTGFNLQYPDDGVTYWGTQYKLPVGATLALQGRFPHARHMSINAYDANGSPLDRIVDHLLQPEGGAVNPFRVGARRDGAARDWRIRIEPRELVAGKPLSDNERAPNTLYVPNGEPVTELVYRVYLPDAKRDATGDAGLPHPVLTLASGHKLEGEALCRAIVMKEGAVRDIHVAASSLQPLFSLPSRAPYHPAQPQPRWNAFFNPTLGIASLFIGTPWEAVRSRLDATKRGGFYGTLDNTYMTIYVDDRYNDTLVVRGKAPTTPHTQHGDKAMQAGDLRYWSFCKYRSLSDTAVDSCVNDEQVPLDAQGRYTVVMSPPGKRPANARPECGIAWLPWGVGDGIANPHGGFLLMRQMMPSPQFRPASAFSVSAPGEERKTLGDYYPEPAYMSRAEVEAMGCARR